MADISVNFVHPTDGRLLSVTMDDTMTGQEVVGELIGADFIPASSEGYNLAIKGGAELDNAASLAEGGVKDNETLKVIPATDAGVVRA